MINSELLVPPVLFNPGTKGIITSPVSLIVALDCPMLLCSSTVEVHVCIELGQPFHSSLFPPFKYLYDSHLQ